MAGEARAGRPRAGPHRSTGYELRASTAMTTPGWRTPRSTTTRRSDTCRRRSPPGPCVLRRPRHHPHQRAHHRQPPRLPAARRAFATAVEQLGARQLFIKPHCPWQNGKAERYNGTLQSEWAYLRVFRFQRRPRRGPCAMADRLQHSTPSQRTRRLSAHQPTVTNLLSRYT